MELPQILDLLRGFGGWVFSVAEIKNKNLGGLRSFQAFPSFAHKSMSDYLQAITYLFSK